MNWPPSNADTPNHGQHFVAVQYPDCWYCRSDAAHEHHSGGAKHNSLCYRCNPDAPKWDGSPGGPRYIPSDPLPLRGFVHPPTTIEASWGHETRVAYLKRRLRFTPDCGPTLIDEGFWTGEFDAGGQPIPSNNALIDGRWQREVMPVYNSSDPALNKMRSLRDTLLSDPSAGPRLVAAGLWSGGYDAMGFPIPA